MATNGCAFGKVTRNMVENQKEEHNDFKTYITREFDDLKKINTKLYNHLSSRLPAWASILFTIGASVMTGLIVWGLNK